MTISSLSSLGRQLVAVACIALAGATAEAGTVYAGSGSTISGSGGRPVAAEAEFTFGAGSVTIRLTNTTEHTVAVSELLTGLQFDFVPAVGTVTLSAATAAAVHTVVSGGSFTTATNVDLLDAPHPKNSGTGPTWELATGSSLQLKWKPDPNYAILGPTESGGTYSQANSSIAGNGPHNPFVGQTAVFTLTASGISAGSIVENVVFFFGTNMESSISSQAVVPLPSSVLMGLGLMSGLGALGLARRRRRTALSGRPEQ